ncbi:nose resistant to fluoxetine protein 6-like [Tribolium madens]|uniref:nose resistant to fluoxetine protein 6-like n=1 Tax=Tribolium madens TaxID=41895 RepID=UPI001CF72B05|nr:nose resistant to fluoxetine protein 6-like [Tribolium madens]
MSRFRKKIFALLFVGFLSFVGASDDNVMKILQRQSGQPLLKYNTAKEEAKNMTGDDATGYESFVAYDLQILIDTLEVLNDTQCSRDAMTVMEGIAKRALWALQMFDASSKFPVGLLHGNFYQLGNFDECIKVGHNSPIRGQYCLASVELIKKPSDGRVARSFEKHKDKPRHIFNRTMFWSVCVPSSCTVDEVRLIVKQLFTLATKQPITVTLREDKCHVDKNEPITALEIVYGCIVGIFSVFIIFATVFHYCVKHNVESGSVVKDAIFCFSLIKTVGKFLTTKTSSLNLECLSGIKFISMLFIIAGHSFLFLVGGPVQNTDFYEEESRNVLNAIFVNSPLLVDTFLLVSGFLMCYLLLLELDKRKGKINVLVLYIARYIRLTPSYLVVIGFYCTFLSRIGDGPLWDSRIKNEQEKCQKSWWTNLLYVNNYVNTDNMCMFQSWYLAADYHLFIIAPFIIYPLWKFSKVGKTVLGLGVFISVAIPFIVTIVNKLDPTLMIFAPEVYEITDNYYFKTAYIKTHMRAGSYFFGLFFGYLLYKLQSQGTKLSKRVIWFGWFLCTTCGITSMYSIVVFYAPEHQYNAVEAAIYASLHRVAWCISIGWIMIACITKNAPIVNQFLSWKPFMPLSRLTYCAYLCNGFIEIYSLGLIRQGTYMGKFELGTKSLAHCVLTFGMAFVLCIFFESPIHGLEKILLRRVPQRTSKVKAVSNETVSTEI